jgi:hypothetical protein
MHTRWDQSKASPPPSSCPPPQDPATTSSPGVIGLVRSYASAGEGASLTVGMGRGSWPLALMQVSSTNGEDLASSPSPPPGRLGHWREPDSITFHTRVGVVAPGVKK